MLVILTLISKIFPIYLNIVIGYIATKFLRMKSQHIAFIVVYFLAPLVVFFAILSIKIDFQLVSIPILIFTFSTLSAFFVLKFYKKFWNDSSLNTLAFTCGSGNTAYFGIPLALVILEPQYVNIYIFITLASTMYEYTVGFYVTAKGEYSSLQSLKKVLKLPLIYAFVIAIILNSLGYKMPETFTPYFEDLKFIYGLLGMMILGMGFKNFNLKEDLDKKYIFFSYFHKFLIWPSFMILIQIVDRIFFNFFNEELYFMMFLFSIVPLAGNTVTFAILLNAKPQKASFTVLLSTFISLFSIPLMIFLYNHLITIF